METVNMKEVIKKEVKSDVETDVKKEMKSPALKELLKVLRSSNLKGLSFKESEKSIGSALHIPYSGVGSNCKYVYFDDYLQDDVYSLLLESFDNTEGCRTVTELREAFEDYDDDGGIHYFVESTLTWQQSLRACSVILNELSEYEEDDSGLWEGQQPEQAIVSKAFWTYKTGLICHCDDLLKEYDDLDDDLDDDDSEVGVEQ